uniref:Conotoxin O3 superfamily protein n=1 Tax=Conus araneosus TaxID=101286 RepID=A0AA50LU46_CONAO|nr:conotoxin precursor O3 superfamily protein [Conus araneosus]
MSGLGIMVLTLLLLVSMATNHQDGRVRRLMLRNRLRKMTCSSEDDCPDDQECCLDNLGDTEGFCIDDCTIY